MSKIKEFFQRLIFRLFATKYMRQNGSSYINYPARCLQCGKWYIPAKVAIDDPFDISEMLINNWCSRKCYDKDQ